MVDSVKEFGEVQIDHVPVSLEQVLAAALDGVAGGTFRAKAEAVVRERRVPQLPEHLGDRLLDEAVEHGGDAEQAGAAVGLADLLPADRKGLVGAVEQPVGYASRTLPLDGPRTPLIGWDTR